MSEIRASLYVFVHTGDTNMKLLRFGQEYTLYPHRICNIGQLRLGQVRSRDSLRSGHALTMDSLRSGHVRTMDSLDIWSCTYHGLT